MTATAYIQAKFEALHVELSADMIGVELGGVGVDGDADASTVPTSKLDLCMYKLFPIVLAQPNISEGQYSISRTMVGLKEYYKSLALKLGLPYGEAQITDVSGSW